MNSYLANNYQPYPITIAKAEDVYLIDIQGRRYLDMLGAYSAQSLGYGNKFINDAIINAITQKGCPSRAVNHDLLEIFAQKVAQISGLSDQPYGVRVLPLNGGGEATGRAVKIARKYAHERKNEDDPKIILNSGFFHGRELVFSSNSDQLYQSQGYGPAVPGIRRIPYNNCSVLRKIMGRDKITMFFTEPIQAEGGVIIGTKEYLQKARDLCTEYDVIFGLDEIQTGLGRTGKMWAYEHAQIKPDIMTIGKALGGGHIPVSAVVGKKEIMDVLVPGSEGSTFGGCPAACAAGIASIEYILQEGLVEQAATKGNYLKSRLQESIGNNSLIREIRGQGLLLGIELRKPIAHDVAVAFLDEKVIVKDTREHILRLAPPLIISKNKIDQFILTAERVFHRLEDTEFGDPLIEG